MAKKDEEKVEGEAAVIAEATDGPLLDLNDAAVKRMIKLAKKRGFVTYSELNAVLPSEESVLGSDRGHVFDAVSEMGINVSRARTPKRPRKRPSPGRGRRARRRRTGRGRAARPRSRPAVSEPTERTDDPVRMYLREMGSVELLSREGEIAIAKRIEAGREAMIAGLCESPLTFQAIIIWRDELERRQGSAARHHRSRGDLRRPRRQEDGRRSTCTADPAPRADGRSRTPAASCGASNASAPLGAAGRLRPDRSWSGDGGEPPPPEENFDDEDDMENSVSLSAMEAELKPKVLETFDRVADAYKKLRRLQDQNVENKLKNETLSPAQERKYKALKKEIVADVKSLSLNQNRIDALVEQLYDINKRLIGLDVKLMRLAESHRVAREDFLEELPQFRTRSQMAAARLQAGLARLEGFRRQGQGPDQGFPLRHPGARDRDRPRDLRNSASSCRWCRRASAKRARPRRKWSRPICASSSRSPRNTPTAACSSSTSSRKAISA